MKVTLLYYFLAMLALVGCQSVPPGPRTMEPLPELTARPDPARALLYIFRPVQQGASNVAVEFFVNERSVVTLEADTFTRISIFPGLYRVVGRTKPLLKDIWLPPGQFRAVAGSTYYIYPITKLQKAERSPWEPILVGVSSLILSRGTYYLIPIGAPADIEAGHYWQIADQNTPDAYVDRIKSAQFIAIDQPQIEPLKEVQ